MKVKIKKLHPDAVIPKYAHDTDAGLDLVATSLDYNPTYDFFEYGTGLAISIPEGHVGLIFPRSSISKMDLTLANSVGVIDSGYTGEIMFRFKSIGDGLQDLYSVGDKIGQLIIMPYPKVEFEEVDDLGESERGSGGFGSTGE